jgi:hypothetical protein
MEADSNPSLREILGIALVALCLALVPVAFMYGVRFLVIAVVAGGAGTLLFHTGRVRRRAREARRDGGTEEMRDVPPGSLDRDWRGGRSELMDRDGGDGDGGGGD